MHRVEGLGRAAVAAHVPSGLVGPELEHAQQAEHAHDCGLGILIAQVDLVLEKRRGGEGGSVALAVKCTAMHVHQARFLPAHR